MLASFKTYIYSPNHLLVLIESPLSTVLTTTALLTAAPIKETFAPPTLTREWTEDIQPQETALDWGTRGHLGG